MLDWLLIATRLVLYLDLGLLFGAPLFGLYALRGDEQIHMVRFRPLIGSLAAAGIIATPLGFGLMSAAMSGTDLWSIDRNILTMLLTETAVGWAFGVREVSLVLILASAMLVRRPSTGSLAVVSALAAIAVGTLAWSGHGAGTEGTSGLFHLTGDIAHLLAASAWLGALMMLILLTLPARVTDVSRIEVAHRALNGFAGVGSVIVGLIVITGLTNGLYLVGIDKIANLATDLWGQLLLAKIALFVAMLVMAAANRFRLTPRLDEAIAHGSPGRALSSLRRSIALEAAMAITILALVAWLGTLEPLAAG
ncbi:MAG: copper homeostasis membrane protein CopD [Sphingobium sp.]|jgi:putative copper resistance protein D|uniref:copper homeostasis membrane protein CopD n=1 Tax=Sphingobium sp. JS3065 TaxID=2970925 RepID=UPI002264F900|nr:copper homeostasis membrane protein CopD [Sphingobium sp. JS3065]MCI1270677.1 copper homeostasis membrane protein CopD [Sphingobium sp.]MCI1754406.1 copper homeostasis membrane protein CopD [Sphingobium sp.]MCI2053364.1 copper homeostasis membrane protein CopD [Sphingobium sp.]UZW56731.1 copper homeostasis membrane protein CopD [Sphingobium sp. JS3065]